MNQATVQEIIEACYPAHMRALGSRGTDVVEAALAGDVIKQNSAEYGRANDIWPIIEQVSKVVPFVKCAVETFFSARKDGREVADHEVKDRAEQARIYIPSQDEMQKILEETRRHFR